MNHALTPAAKDAKAALRVRSLPRLSVTGWIGAAIVAFWLAMIVLGPVLAPYDPGEMLNGVDVFAPMSLAHWLGTDYLGRDMLSRVLMGVRYTVGVALIATLIASGLGVTLGLLAAVSRRWLDATLSRSLDVLVAIPSKMFALVVVAAFGSSIPTLILTAAIAYTPGAFRISRSLAVNINTMDYVLVARTRGEGLAYIMRREILPNIMGPVLADFGLRFVYVVLLLAGMSFLGLGVQPPFADWGSLVRENIGGLDQGAVAVIAPAIAIATLTIGVNLLIDNLPGHARRDDQGH